MRPLPKGQMPAMARNSVDLPDPDGPVTSTRSPGGIASAVAGHQRLAIWQIDGDIVDLNAGIGRARHDLDDRRRHRDRATCLDRTLEAGEPGDHRAPFGELAVDGSS